ncbi:MAG: copper homeostasis protein CutC [Flavobacteriaceae bacterium]|nr:copper homeostasis protein CutC [Flavobacteriaceae bacterium]
MQVEICANSVESAINAEKAGANRIELCSELALGGITPSYGVIKRTVEALSIPVHVLIRPRSGDFVYSDEEFEVIKEDIRFCKEIGCAGIVSGVLDKQFQIDITRTSELIALSRPLKFTFHRAFDLVKDPFQEIKKLSEIGVDLVLTSGGKSKAINGIETLEKLKAENPNISIMPGSGVGINNINTFLKEGFENIHFSGTIAINKLDENPRILFSDNSMLDDKKVWFSDISKIQDVVLRIQKS